MDGTLRRDGDRMAVRFERVLDAPQQEVWAALTDPALLERWLAAATVDARPNGSVALRFDDGHMEGGRIREFRPPQVLEYTWTFPSEPDSVVRFELEDAGDGRTRLVLEHRQLGTDSAPGYGAGWQSHLEALAAVLAGADPGDWFARYERLRPGYQEQASALP
jgi:uncharacterized protein YndB with AHSA1/START domain